MTNYTIPPAYQADLEVIPADAEPRTDAQILEVLNNYRPVVSEKNIWAFWHSGLSTMPAWCQRNVTDWVRICGSTGWTVRVLDNLPTSPNYALNYIEKDLLPEAFVSGTMDGPYSGPHSADLLRGACLLQHGGVFMDVGNILIRHMDRICWDEIEDSNTPFNVAVPIMYGQTMANHFVASRKGDPFIKRWHELFTHLWKGHTNHSGLIENPLISFGANISFEDSQANNFHWDFNVPPKTVMEYISQVMSWTRLCMLEDAGDGFSCSEYWQRHILCFEVLKEDWPAEASVGFDHEKIFRLLTIKVEGEGIDKTAEEYKQAEQLVWGMLAKGSMEKVTHGKGLTNSISLGTLLDQADHMGKYQEVGTFFGLLRYGTVHFRQTRAGIATMKAEKSKTVTKKGVLEP